MKKFLLFAILILVLLVSCDFAPFESHFVTLEIRGRDCDVYWHMVKDGEEDTGEYKHYPVKDYWIYDLEPFSGYTIYLYNVVSTIIEEVDGVLVEKRVIDQTYQTHITIDYYTTILAVTVNDGLGLEVDKSYRIPTD